jgi:hypothetical protein
MTQGRNARVLSAKAEVGGGIGSTLIEVGGGDRRVFFFRGNWEGGNILNVNK